MSINTYCLDSSLMRPGSTEVIGMRSLEDEYCAICGEYSTFYVVAWEF